MEFGRAFTYITQDPDWLKKVGIAAGLMLIPVLGWIVVTLVFNLPGGLVNACQSIISALISNPEISRELGSDASAILAAGGILALCFACLGLLLNLAATFITPAALGNMMACDAQVGAAFRFGEIFGMIRNAIGPYLMVLLGTVVIGFIVPLGLIVCIIGIAATAAWGSTVLYHLYGQAYKAAKASAPVL